MFRLLQTTDRRLSTASLFAAFAAAVALHLLATQWLNASYQASGFPVPYYVAQLSFDAQALKGWYAQILELKTLGPYIQTQIIDFAFIGSVALLHPAGLLLIGRLFRAGSRGRQWLVFGSALSLLAPAADAAENLVSFVMLANPGDFWSPLAIIYSSFAATKFFVFAATYVGAAAAIAWAVLARLRAAGVEAAR